MKSLTFDYISSKVLRIIHGFSFSAYEVEIKNTTNKKLIKFFIHENEPKKNGLIISCFSGFIDRDNISILSRIPSDLILFNCRADYLWYLQLGEELGFYTGNGFCFGYPQLILLESVIFEKQVDIVFFEQVIVPSTFSERCYLLKKLVDLANAFPERKVLIKPRCKPGGRTIHKQKWHLERLRKLLRIRLPDNLCFTYEPVEQLLSKTALCLTISSTVAVEALARGIPTVIISDFGVRRDIHTASFVGSGCLATIDQVIAGYLPKPNKEWLDDYVKIPDVDAFKIRLNDLISQKRAGLLPQREYPDGAFSLAPDLKPLVLKRIHKLFIDPHGFCCDSRFYFLNKIGGLLFK
ncbi:MAG: DUF6716 putative glycosyltransferase [Aeromonas veronii]